MCVSLRRLFPPPPAGQTKKAFTPDQAACWKFHTSQRKLSAIMKAARLLVKFQKQPQKLNCISFTSFDFLNIHVEKQSCSYVKVSQILDKISIYKSVILNPCLLLVENFFNLPAFGAMYCSLVAKCDTSAAWALHSPKKKWSNGENSILNLRQLDFWQIFKICFTFNSNF